MAGALCVIDTSWNKTACRNLASLGNLLYDVVTVDCQAECFTNQRIGEYFILCVEAYIVSTNVIRDLKLARC